MITISTADVCDVLDYICDKESVDMDFYNFNKEDNLDTGVIAWAADQIRELMGIFGDANQAFWTLEDRLYELAIQSPTNGQKRQFMLAYDFVCDVHSLIEDSDTICDYLSCQMLWR